MIGRPLFPPACLGSKVVALLKQTHVTYNFADDN